MQPVYVLGDDAVDPTVGFPTGDQVVRQIGLSPGHPSPPDVAPRPIPPPGERIPDELAIVDRCASDPLPIAPIVGDSRVGGDPRTAQDDDSSGGDELCQLSGTGP